jgi:hypothetical protein
MTTIGALRAAVDGAGAERTLTLDRAFQGLPDTAHGGTVLAAFDHVAGRRGPRTLLGHYLRRVPLGVRLRLRVGNGDGHLTVLDEGGPLVEGAVRAPAVEAAGTPAAPPPQALPLPVSRGCFACGVDNPLGLAVVLRADDDAVGATWTPRPGFRADDGTLASLALTTLLDETAFWLGALVTGESGMTTELTVTLHADAMAEGAVTVAGARASVRPRAGDPRYWDTVVGACDAAGRLVASGAITFVAVRGAARRLAAGMLTVNPAEIVRRVFPAYVR